MNDIIKIANEIANSTNNATNFTNIQNTLPKTEQQIKDEVVEMIYQKHLQAQEWGNKLNEEFETNTHKHRHEKSRRNKRDFLGIGNWIENAAVDTVNWVGGAAVDTVNAVGTAGEATGKWVGGAAVDTVNWVGGAAVDTVNWVGDATMYGVRRCITNDGVLVEMATGAAVGAGAGAAGGASGGPIGAAVGAGASAVGGAVAPCAGKIVKDLFNIKAKRHIHFNDNNANITKLLNLTKWTDDFTKSINHEQYLPIDNKTNFVTSNITSL